MSIVDTSANWSSAASSRLPAVDPPPVSPLDQLHSLLLLAGSLRANPFEQAIGRSILDLPADPERTLLDLWCEHAQGIASATRWAEPRIRVLAEKRSADIHSRTGGVEIARDREAFRGTGGVLHDATVAMPDNSFILVGNGADLLREELYRSAAALAATGADVAMIGCEDGSPTSLFLMRCAVLRQIPAVGYVDLKEQALPAIARRHRVAVVTRRHAIGIAVRTPSQYIAALRWHHQRLRGLHPVPDPFAENWKPVFSLAEYPAKIHRTARLLDSVVLADGQVQAGATVVRSVVGPGGVVPADAVVADSLVTGQTVRPFSL